MVHQRSYSLPLLLCGLATVTVEHVVPIIDSLSKIGSQGLVMPYVGMLTCPLHGPIPKLHHLGHGCSNATCHAMVGCKKVIRRVLIPPCGNQRLHRLVRSVVGQTSCGPHHRPPLCRRLIGIYMVFDVVFNLLHKALQIILQLNGYVLRVELSFIGIS